MKSFKTLGMVQKEKSRVWAAFRDHLPTIASGIENIERVESESRTRRSDGVLSVVNVWYANVGLPGALSGLAGNDKFVWTDRATWDERSGVCSWAIEPRALAERLRCHGTTTYEAALGGRGTRISFHGEIDFNAAGLPGVPGVLTGALTTTLETFLSSLIPANFQKLVRAVGAYVNSETSGAEAAASARGAGASGLIR